MMELNCPNIVQMAMKGEHAPPALRPNVCPTRQRPSSKRGKATYPKLLLCSRLHQSTAKVSTDGNSLLSQALHQRVTVVLSTPNKAHHHARQACQLIRPYGNSTAECCHYGVKLLREVASGEKLGLGHWTRSENNFKI